MSTRKLTEIANQMLEEQTGKRKQIPDLTKLVNRAINMYAKHEDNNDNMLDFKIASSSIVDGKLHVVLHHRDGDKNQHTIEQYAFDFVLIPKPLKMAPY